MRVRAICAVVVFGVAACVWSQTPQRGEVGAAGPETPSERMLLESEGLGVDALLVGNRRSRYDDRGYPEDAAGRLVLESHEDGPILTMEHDPVPYLLYAQYVNRQRDAVILARTGTVNDVLPSGASVEIPYGYGAVRFNTVYVSIVESLLVPHFSDNEKEYVQFPLTDFYLGAGFSLTGPTAVARYVHTGRYVGYLAAGFNPSASSDPASLLSRYVVPIHLGGGYRFPGALPDLLGENNWTVGAELLVGVGDPDPEAAPEGGVLVPGVFLDVERVLFDEGSLRRDIRTDPRPYNYGVNALVVRVGAYLNVTDAASGLLIPMIGLSYQYNVLGPRIPEHDFKETQVLYVSDVYREDLRRQAERREARQ